MPFLDILVVFRLDFGQICFNLVQKAFATQQFALCAICIPFCDIWARACTEIKIFGRESGLRLKTFRFLNFFFLFLSSFFLFAAVIGLLLGLVAVKKLLRKPQRDGQI